MGHYLCSSVLVFDSGMGGLTVAGAIRRRMPDALITYAADTAGFPYGAWAEPVLVERICAVIARLIDETAPDVAVIACNTASTVALAALRNRFKVPFVGTVPAIKPAAGESTSRIIGVLATPGTVKREYTQALIDTYAYHCEVVLHGAAGLAALAERKMRGEKVPLDEVAREIAPAFVERPTGRTDVVVLGCTHYPLLLDELQRAAPWPCRFIDPSDAIARRARDIAPVAGERAEPVPGGIAIVTSREGLAGAEVFASFGFSETRLMEMPVEVGV